MLSYNGINLTEGLYIKLTGCKVKNDNGIYIIKTDYNTNPNVYTHDEYLLKKVNTDGTESKAKYNMFFLDGKNPQRKNPNLQFEVIEKEGLKQAQKEVKAYLKSITDSEKVHTFKDLDVTKIEDLREGMFIKINKGLLLVGHINRITGTYKVVSISEKGVKLHLIGAKGEEVKASYNVYAGSCNYYQGRPVILLLDLKTIDHMFLENYMTIQERITATKGELSEKVEIENEIEVKQEETTNVTNEEVTKPEKKEEGETMSSKERIYYPINESTARTAKHMNSFSEYKEGEATEEYKYYCDKVYNILDQIREQKPTLAEKAEGMAGRYCKKLAEYYNDYYRNETSCPSIMISGGSNFPVRKKEKQNSRRKAIMDTWNYLQGYSAKIENLLTQEQPILSKDENAIQLIIDKITTLEETKETMKAINKYYKQHGTIDGFTGNVTKELKRHIEFMENQGWNKGRIFDTTNTNAEIKRLQARLETLQKAKEKGTTETTTNDTEGNELFKVVENTEIMRLQLLFDGKPDEGIRNILKKNGFRWSPRNEAWQRQLTDNARYSLKRVIEQLKTA